MKTYWLGTILVVIAGYTISLNTLNIKAGNMPLNL